VFVNEHWCSIAGVEAESGLGRGWTTVIHPEDIEVVVRERTRCSDEQREFERMYRSEEAERRQIQGTGLGLTIVKAIVDAHEATIEVESALGEGTAFRVWLPRRVRAEVAGEHSRGDRAPTHR
jgi:signal transduction histidine kinase